MAFETVSSSSFPRERRPPRTACSLSPRASNIAGQCTGVARKLGLNGHLAHPAGSRDHRQMDSEQLVVRADVDAILAALLGIRREVSEIRRLLEEPDGEE